MTNIGVSVPPAALIAEHEAWFAEQRRAYNDMRPVPVAAWDGSSLYRQIANHTQGFMRHLRPLAECWWKQRGYRVDWASGSVFPIERMANPEVQGHSS